MERQPRLTKLCIVLGFLGVSVVKDLTAKAGDARDMGSILGWEDALENGMATHFSIIAQKIPQTEEPGRL